MAQQCFQNEYFDSLLSACKPCHLRCSNTPPRPCQRHCNAMKETNEILWTCLGLSLTVSVTVLMLMVLLRKRRFEPLQDKTTSPGLAPQHQVKTDPEQGGVGAETAPPRGRLEYTVEECTCADCAPPADPDPLFPLPIMEEGATMTVSTKASAAGGELPGAEAPGDGEVCLSQPLCLLPRGAPQKCCGGPEVPRGLCNAAPADC